MKSKINTKIEKIPKSEKRAYSVALNFE